MDTFSLSNVLYMYLRALGWIVVAAIGFSFSISFAIKIFTWMSGEIDEWEEIRKGNIGVSLIILSIIVMIGLLIYKVI